MIVRNVLITQGKVEVVLDNQSFFISKENYIENPISINSDISEDKIKFLIEEETYVEEKQKVLKRLNKKLYSEGEIRKELTLLTSEQKNRLINELKNIGLINDEYYASILIDSLLVKRKGKKEIYSYLKDKYINESIINQEIEKIDKEIYLDNAKKVFEKYLKMYSNKSYKIREKMIEEKLKEYGYEDEIINSFDVEEDSSEELELARKELLKILRGKEANNYDYETVNKIKIKLANKGFSYDIINFVVEEAKHNETY